MIAQIDFGDPNDYSPGFLTMGDFYLIIVTFCTILLIALVIVIFGKK